MGYYREKLSGNRLKRCYDIAPPRIRQYLNAEIQHARSRIAPGDTVLELGCGYGRVVMELADRAGQIVGIDTAMESLEMARAWIGERSNCAFVGMDAARMGFSDDSFDTVLCVQNGVCAFGVESTILIQEALRVVRAGGTALFSTYSHRVWPHRLAWFEEQSAHGLLGEIDYESTGDGVIVCKDGFRAGALTETEFREICTALGCEPVIDEVDASSIFCEITKPASV